jgi:hypothetical protein
MSKNFPSARSRPVRVLLVSGLVCAVVPSVASASAVNLETASPFVVLGGSTVTNTGASVLNGDLGVATGTSLTGFGLPAVVNGATHDDDSVAALAQGDLTAAYTTAASQAVSPGDVLTGQDLGGLTLTPGAYSFSSSAGLTGALTLNGEGNPNAQFVFEVGSTLTTAAASSVVLINGASPCDVYWQIGSSATLGSASAFQGNVMASDSISLNSGVSVQGRLLARTGAVTLNDDTINNAICSSSTPTPTGTGTPTSSGTPGPATAPTPTSTSASAPTSTGTPSQNPVATTGPAHTAPAALRRGTAKLSFAPSGPQALCSAGFSATVSGREIKRVVFSANGIWLGTRVRSAFRVHVAPEFAHSGLVQARVTFKDATHARTLSLRYRACAAAVVHPLPAPSTFTG